MVETIVAPQYELLVGGSPAPQNAQEALIAIRVRQHLELMDTLEVVLDNHSLAWTESDTFLEGKTLAVKLGYTGKGMALVGTGEIVRRECAFPVDGQATVTIVAYDRKHRLKRGVHTRTFTNKKDSEIVQQLAGEVGLTAEVEDTAVVHKYVLQSAQTNLSFLRERARLLNFELAVDATNTKLLFRKAKTAQQSIAALEWGVNLYSFQPRLTTSAQLNRVQVRGWDPLTKRPITASASEGDQHYKLDGARSGAQVAQAVWGAREAQYNDRPLMFPDEATALAKAELNTQALRYCQAQVSCVGDSTSEAGAVVEIKRCGTRLDGKYYVVSTLHYLEPRLGYTTHFDAVRSTQKSSVAPQGPPPEPLPARQEELPAPDNFVETRVTSDDGRSLEGTPYTVTLANGTTQQGKLDSAQKIRIDGIRDPGDARIELHPPEDAKPVG